MTHHVEAILQHLSKMRIYGTSRIPGGKHKSEPDSRGYRLGCPDNGEGHTRDFGINLSPFVGEQLCNETSRSGGFLSDRETRQNGGCACSSDEKQWGLVALHCVSV